MTRSAILAVAVVVFGLVGVASAQAQEKSHTAIGPVAKISGDSLTVDTAKGPVNFVTSASTAVKVTGGSAKARAAKAEGEKGVKVTDAVHVGDQVSVKYTDEGGKFHATEIDVKQRRPLAAQPVK